MNEKDFQDQMRMLIEDGILIEQHDEYGRSMYTPTQKFYDEYPDAAKEWDAAISSAIFSLWQKGFVELEFADNGFYIELTKSALDFNLVESLDEFESGILRSISYMLMEER